MADETRSFSSKTRKPARRAPVDAELGVGLPNGVDAHNLGGEDRPQQAWGEPAAEAHHGANHTRRPDKTEAARGQGRKTIQRNKAIVKGGLYR